MNHRSLQKMTSQPAELQRRYNSLTWVTRLRILPLVSCSILLFSSYSQSQDFADFETTYPSGVRLTRSVGFLAVVDESISNEKYDGSVSGWKLEWTHYHETYGYRVGMWYQEASQIKNFNISAKSTQGGLYIENLYPVGSLNLFNRKTSILLGPMTEIFINYRRQNIAQNPNNELNIYQSGTLLFSLGVRGEATIALGPSIKLEGALQLSLLSLGGGAGNTPNSVLGVKLVTLFGGMRGDSEVGLRYNLLDFISMRAGYLFDILRINSWNYVLASSDNAFVSVQCHF